MLLLLVMALNHSLLLLRIRCIVVPLDRRRTDMTLLKSTNLGLSSAPEVREALLRQAVQPNPLKCQ